MYGNRLTIGQIEMWNYYSRKSKYLRLLVECIPGTLVLLVFFGSFGDRLQFDNGGLLSETVSNLGLVDTIRTYMGCVWPRSVQCHFGAIRGTQNGRNLKIAGRRVKRIEIWDSGVIVGHISSTFDLVVFKVFGGSFGHLPRNSLQLENG